MPQPKHRYTMKLRSEGPWREDLADDDVEARPGWLALVNQARKHNVVDLTRENQVPEYSQQVYEDAYGLINSLASGVTPAGPLPATFDTLSPDAQARCLQSLLTQLAQELGVEPEPPDDNNGGGGGGSGSGNPPPSPPQPSPPQAAPQGQQEPQGQEGQRRIPGRAHNTEETEHEFIEPDAVREPPPEHAGGGGRQRYSRHPESSVFYAVRDLIKKIAVDEDFVDAQPEGSERWNARKLIRANYHPGYLAAHHKMDPETTVDEMYFSLDTSGSVESYAEKVAALAAGSVGYVHLFSGTEGRPLHYIKRTQPLRYPGQSFPEWGRENEDNAMYRRPGFDDFRRAFQEKYPAAGTEFILEVAWLIHCFKPKPGSWLMFWGDGEGPGIPDPVLLRHLVKPYRFVWMTPHSRKGDEEYWHRILNYRQRQQQPVTPAAIIQRSAGVMNSECLKLEVVGLPVIWDVVDGSSVRRALRQLQTIQKRRRYA